MTLDEAIKHAEEVAKKQENNAKNYPKPDRSVRGSGRMHNDYLKCAEEHRQLAEWLKDYKQLLEQEPCDDTISRKKKVNMDNRLFNVIGISDLEGATFGRFTTYSKARTAKEILEAAGYEGMFDIVQDEIPIDHIEIGGKMLAL